MNEKSREFPTALYAVSVAPLADPALYAAAYRAASPGRREKTDRYCRDEDRRLSLGAELLLRYGLSRAGWEFDPAALGVGENGKPFIKNGGAPCFNLSHAGEIALCAVSPMEVGCDVERIGKSDPEIARRFFDPEEAREILDAGDGADTLFTRYWTLKESFLKVTGLGMKLPLSSFRVDLGGKIRVTCSGNFSGRDYTFREFVELPGYRAALCVRGECGDVTLRMPEWSDLLGGNEVIT